MRSLATRSFSFKNLDFSPWIPHGDTALKDWSQISLHFLLSNGGRHLRALPNRPIDGRICRIILRVKPRFKASAQTGFCRPNIPSIGEEKVSVIQGERSNLPEKRIDGLQSIQDHSSRNALGSHFDLPKIRAILSRSKKAKSPALRRM